jgi:hypothetical protein
METFVVRVWRSTGDEPLGSPELHLPLRGLVEHVGSAKPIPFQSGGELLGILESRLVDAAPPTGPGDRVRPADSRHGKGESGMRTIGIVLALTLGAATGLVAQEESRVFPTPSVEGRRLDLCFVWGAQCGQPAADAFCQVQGFDAASAWEPDNDIGIATPTIVLTGGAVCSHPDCDGFRTITCTRTAPPAITEPFTVPGAEILPVAESEPWTTQDVIDERIDVQAQYALMRMFAGEPLERVHASNILSAVKSEALGGIYQEDQQVPALRAQSLGYGWWEILPKPQGGVRIDGICMTEPSTRPPILVMRRKAENSHAAYDKALQDAWLACGLPPSPVRPYRTTLPPKPTQTAKAGRCAAPGESNTLSVWVTHGPKHAEGIAGAQVSVQGAGTSEARTSDEYGTAWFDLPAGGLYLVIASGPPAGLSPYGSASRTVEVLPQCTSFTSISLPTTAEGPDCGKRAEDLATAMCYPAVADANQGCNARFIDAMDGCAGDETCEGEAQSEYGLCMAPIATHYAACRNQVMTEASCEP